MTSVFRQIKRELDTTHFAMPFVRIKKERTRSISNEVNYFDY
jgi:hypothetical protein